MLPAMPTEAVSPVASKMRALMARAMSSGGPNRRSAPVMSRKASSKLSGSTRGLKSSMTFMS